MNEQQYARQKAFTERYVAHVAKQGLPTDPVSLTKELVLSLHREVDELLDELPWKLHRTYDTVDVMQANIREEVIDVLKFAFEAAIVNGITYAELVEEFNVKSDVVDDRWRQDHDTGWGDKPLVLLDLDGVLNDYPAPFLNFVYDHSGQRFKTMEELEENAPELKVEMKHKYRQSGIKRLLPARDDSVYACRALVTAGYEIVIVSQRPAERYSRITSDTIYWLRSNGVPYRKLIFADYKQRRLLVHPLRSRIKFAVDDDADVADKLRDLGIKTYWLGGDVASMLEIPEVKEAIGKRAQRTNTPPAQ